MMITFLALDAAAGYKHTHTHMSEHQRHIDSEIERRKSGVEVRDL